MSANDQNQNGEGDPDEDFEDFGGFEAAEPVEPNIAQAAPAGVPGAASPWASMFTAASGGSGNVQPDLLCGQNRFPQHLDSPTTVDVAGSAVASVGLIPDEDLGSATNGAAMNDLIPQGLEELNPDQISMANDILDGSFRSTSSNQSNPGFAGQGREPLPDISGLSLHVGLADNINLSASAGGAAEGGGVSSLSADQNFADFSAVNQAGTQQVEEGHVAMAMANQAREEGAVELETSAEVHNYQSLLQRAEEERCSIQTELEKQIQDNSRLTQDLTQAREAAEKAKQKYEETQVKHNAELEELRGAGHQTLAVVVEEYKELMKSTVAQQQEMCETQMVEKLKEESERFQDLLQQQRDEQKVSQQAEETKVQDRLESALVEMKEHEKEEFQTFLSEERQRTDESLAKAVQQEKQTATEAIENVIEEERRKAVELLEEQQQKFTKQLTELEEQNKKTLQEAIEKEQHQFKEQQESMLCEERERGRTQTQEAVSAVRDQMKDYVQEIRQVDRAQSRRQLASLDLFLESARQQLSLLMNREPVINWADNKLTGSDDKSEAGGS